MTLAEIIAEAKRLDEAATKGPWVSERVSTLDYGNGFVASVPAREGDVLCEYAISADGVTHVPAETGQHDAAFIAFARAALPLLLAGAEAAMEMRGALAALYYRKASGKRLRKAIAHWDALAAPAPEGEGR